LEQRQVTPVGANKPVPIDIRVVAATNLPPEKLRDEAHFRQDLLFRLNTVEIDLPPLSQRRVDIPELIDHYLAHYARRYGREVPTLSPGGRAALLAHDWPGNVRALRHALERAVILSEGPTLRLADFPLAPAEAPRAVAASATEATGGTLAELEKQAIAQALARHAGNVTYAAQELGITRTSLYRRMEKHGL
jgi:DNA-binding NtrC family response regulator